MDPVAVAWEAAGGPVPAAPATGVGSCARCAQPGSPLQLTSAVVSDRFTGYSHWAAPSGEGLCAACTWAYRDPRLRAHPTLTRFEPRALEVLSSPGALREVLRSPVEASVAVAVPLIAGRRHVLPESRFGSVCVDGTCVRWTTDDVHRLDVLEQLRQAGASSRALSEPAPSWALVKRTPPGERGALLEQWGVLQPWRQARPWFDLAVKATAGQGPA